MILNETIINGQKIKTNCRYLIKKGFFSYEEIKVLEITDKFVKLNTGWKSHSSLKVICKLPTLEWKDEFELWNWYDAMNLQRNGWRMPTIQELIEASLRSKNIEKIVHEVPKQTIPEVISPPSG